MTVEKEKHRALLDSVRGAGSTIRWIQGIVGAGIVAVLVGLMALSRGHFFAGWWWLYAFKGGAALGMGAGVKLAARRARRTARQLPDPEAIELLRPLAAHSDEATRRIAGELIKELRPEGTEVVAASAPDGAGTEIAPAPEPAPRARRA